MKKILKFNDFIIEQNDPSSKEEEEIKQLDDDINKTKLELKKKELEILRNRQKNQSEVEKQDKAQQNK